MILVLHQDGALGRGRSGQGVVGVEVQHRRRLGGGAGAVDELEHPGHGGVEDVLVQLARADGGDDGGVADAKVGRHLQVQAGGKGGDSVVDRAPVGDDQAVEAPFVPENGGEQPGVLGGVHAVDLVVGAHHRPWPRLGDRALEAGEVDLAKGPLVDLGADPQPVGLLVVDGVVLEGGTHALALDAVDHCRPQDAGEHRILGEVLEVAPAQWGALDVDAWTEHDRHGLRPGLAAQCLTHALHQLRIPGRPKGTSGREAGRRNAARDGDVVAFLGLLAQPVGTVGHHDRRDAEPLHRRRVPEVGAQAQRRLLLQGQLSQQ